MSIRIAVIGAGVMGSDHARIVAEDLLGAALQVVCDAAEDRAHRIADAFGAGHVATDVAPRDCTVGAKPDERLKDRRSVDVQEQRFGPLVAHVSIAVERIHDLPRYSLLDRKEGVVIASGPSVGTDRLSKGRNHPHLRVSVGACLG